MILGTRSRQKTKTKKTNHEEKTHHEKSITCGNYLRHDGNQRRLWSTHSISRVYRADQLDAGHEYHPGGQFNLCRLHFAWLFPLVRSEQRGGAVSQYHEPY